MLESRARNVHNASAKLQHNKTHLAAAKAPDVLGQRLVERDRLLLPRGHRLRQHRAMLLVVRAYATIAGARACFSVACVGARKSMAGDQIRARCATRLLLAANARVCAANLYSAPNVCCAPKRPAARS